MILRIKKIQQIGAFRDFRSGGSVPFADSKNVTLVYGRNTLGKSTLSNILQSLGEDNLELITKRKSIPPTLGISQEIELSYKSMKGQEQTLKFTSGQWQASDLKGNIFVFDQDFAHTHVISGNSITRDNKEEFTDFILGSAGVKLTNEIEDKKKRLRLLKQNLPDYKPEYVKGALTDKDVADFVDLVVEDDTPTLDKSKEYPEKRLNRLDKLSDFKKIAEPTAEIESTENSTSALIKEFTLILGESFDKVSDDAWKVLQAHIASDCKDDHTVSWLKKGMEIKKTSRCPFCSQDLSSVKTLINAYQSIFDDTFEEFEKNLKLRTRELESNLKISVAKSYISPINKFLKEALAFNPYIPELEAEIEKIDKEIKLLAEIDQEFKLDLADWAQQVEDLLGKKVLSLHKPITDTTNSAKVAITAKQVAEKQNDIRIIVKTIIQHITNAVEQTERYTPAQIENEKQKLKAEIDLITRNLARISQDKQCTIYKTKSDSIITLKKNIDILTEQLETEQSDYIDKYFVRLNHWFKELGSNNFSIEKVSNRKGDKKVYSLGVKYHGEPILSEDLGKVFSESDKRNLALSIFFSKIEKLENKKSKIIVLDDPVVSFDDNRRKKTCRELKIIAQDFRQVIVTTHYGSLVRHFIDENLDAQYIKIESENNNSLLKNLDAIKFSISPHEKECEKICLFIDGEDGTGERDLRPFMEEHLHIRFQRQLAAKSTDRLGLEALITELFSQKLISEDNKRRLDAFRESFNPGHHRTSDDENIQEARNDARELLDLLYGELV